MSPNKHKEKIQAFRKKNYKYKNLENSENNEINSFSQIQSLNASHKKLLTFLIKILLY